MYNVILPKESILAIQNEMFVHPSTIVQKRILVLLLAHFEIPRNLIALIVGIHANTVTNTIKDYNDNGIEEVKKLNYRKPQSVLMKWKGSLIEFFEKHPVHSTNEAKEKIKEITGETRSPTQIRNFFKQIGMKYRMIGQIPSKADPEKQEIFLENTLEPLIELAEMGHCHLFFVDAAHFVMGSFLCAIWSFARMFVKAPSGRKRFNVLGAVKAITNELVTVVNDTYVNAETVKELLYKLKENYSSLPIYLVLDNARYQHCAFIEEIAKELNITLVFLPSYSPNLNIIERLWKFIKKEVLYGKYYSDFNSFKTAISDCLHKVNHSEDYKQKLKSLLSLNFQRFNFSQILTV
jgi:transposase